MDMNNNQIQILRNVMPQFPGTKMLLTNFRKMIILKRNQQNLKRQLRLRNLNLSKNFKDTNLNKMKKFKEFKGKLI